MLDQFMRFFYAWVIGRIIGIGYFTVGIISFIVQTSFSVFHNLVFCAKRSLFIIELHLALDTPLLPFERRLPVSLKLLWRTLLGLLLAKLGYLCMDELQQAVAPFLPGSGGMEGSGNPLPDPSGANESAASSSLTIEDQYWSPKVKQRNIELDTQIDGMFREEIFRQTGKQLPKNFKMDNLQEHIKVVREMFSKGTKATLKAEHRSLSSLLTQLRSKEGRPIQELVKLAIKDAVKDSISANMIHPDDFE